MACLRAIGNSIAVAADRFDVAVHYEQSGAGGPFGIRKNSPCPWVSTAKILEPIVFTSIAEDRFDSRGGVDLAALDTTQAGMSLPDRDDYLKEDGASLELRGAYRKHLALVFSLLGETAGKAADMVSPSRWRIVAVA